MTPRRYPWALCTSVLLVAACSDNVDVSAPAATAPAIAPTEPPTEDSVAEPEAPPPPLCSEDNLEGAIAKIEGVSKVTKVACGKYVEKPAKCFELTFKQALDHGATSDGVTFNQRIQLVHRGCDAPTTVSDNGYALYDTIVEAEPNMMFDTNGVFLEHRFQGESLPSLKNRRWSSLSIENGAADLHDVITAFKKLYPNRWVSTGASKGGITAVYHRYLYPNDVDGTVPYVAPASLARLDARYQERLDSNVLPAECAAKVRAFQTGALSTRRGAFLKLLLPSGSQSASEEEYANGYLEVQIVTFDWGFWQSGSSCSEVPSPTDPDAAHVAYFERLVKANGAGPHVAPSILPPVDPSTAALMYEWSWQHGFALQVGKHLTPLLKTTVADELTNDATWDRTMPTVPLPAYDSSLTKKAREWVRNSAERLVLIYGEFDPWTGGALEAPRQASSGRYIVPGASHGASISELPQRERDKAMAMVAAMYGIAPKSQPSTFAPRVNLAHQAFVKRELEAVSKASGLVVAKTL